MPRSLGWALVGLVSATVARADVAPPPGQVRVPVDHVIQTDKAYPEYVFVVVIGGEPGWSYKATLDKDKPLRITGKDRNGRARLCWLAAVPAEAAREFKTDKELVAAVAESKVKGILTAKGADFDSFTVVPERPRPGWSRKRTGWSASPPQRGSSWRRPRSAGPTTRTHTGTARNHWCGGQSPAWPPRLPSAGSACG